MIRQALGMHVYIHLESGSQVSVSRTMSQNNGIHSAAEITGQVDSQRTDL